MLEKINPRTVHPTPGYSHVTISTAGRLAHFAGQCPLDVAGTVVGADGDLEAQVDQVIANCLAVLDAAGTQPSDVVRSMIYVVSAESAVLASVWDRLNESPLAPAFSTASTIIGVTALGFRNQLVEIDLTAALPDQRGPEQLV